MLQVRLRFRIGGSLAYLSHAETLRLFQRACVRAGIPIEYSRGFNPRPRISLPLPTTVGVQGDEELLCFRMSSSADLCGSDDTANRLCVQVEEQLPADCHVLSVQVVEKKSVPQPTCATYVLRLRPDRITHELMSTVDDVLRQGSIWVSRGGVPGKRARKQVEVRRFLRTIRLERQTILIECYVGPGGSIRVEEMLDILDLKRSDLAGPPMRMNVQWQEN